MDLTITKRHSPQTCVPGQTFTYFIAVSNVGSSASSGTVTVTETPPAGLTVTALAGAGWTCTVATRTCTRSDALAPETSYPDIIGDDECRRRCGAWYGDEHRGRSGGGDRTPANNTATDPTVITASGASDLTITKTHNPDIAIPGGDSHVHRDGLECRDWAVEWRGDRDRDAAARADGNRALRHRLGLHRRHRLDLHSKRRARPGGELPTDYRGDQRRRRRGVWGGDEHRRRFRRRRIELVQ